MAIFHGWESADNAPRFDRALARIDADGRRADRADGHAPGRCGRTADRPRLPPLRRARRVAPRARLPAAARLVGAVRLPRPPAQLDPRGGRGRPRAAPGTDRAERRRAHGPAAASLRSALGAMWDEDAGAYRERDLHGDARRHRHRRRPLPALCRRSGRAAGAAACRRAPARSRRGSGLRRRRPGR